MRRIYYLPDCVRVIVMGLPIARVGASGGADIHLRSAMKSQAPGAGTTMEQTRPVADLVVKRRKERYGNMKSSHCLATLGALTALASAIAQREQRNATPDLVISVATGKVTAPDSIGSGWTRVRVDEDGAGHILVFFRFPDRVTDADVKAFLAALDTGRATPRPAVALGGPEIGDTGQVVIELTAGQYVLGCVTRGKNGHRHVSEGEARTMTVTKTSRASGGRAAPPRATQQVRMVDFAYVGPERWQAGLHMLRVENSGQQDHQLRLVRLRAGSTLKDWVSGPTPGRISVPVAGVARLGPGRVAYLPVDLPRGTYVLHCLVADTASGRQHVELGMFRAIQVE